MRAWVPFSLAGEAAMMHRAAIRPAHARRRGSDPRGSERLPIVARKLILVDERCRLVESLFGVRQATLAGDPWSRRAKPTRHSMEACSTKASRVFVSMSLSMAPLVSCSAIISMIRQER